ncbi:uncharacterized protein LOC126434812 [Schistocerca serialis cubense]|uniref:uncharacterized protein LOC126434812 n=1 Tax=Schistocerca serialis cubense TaxID=2023355 RepID=UPI00214F5A62|nr:uncharacterized protein LOC126434812 [Schistocerca serialis cubense]
MAGTPCGSGGTSRRARSCPQTGRAGAARSSISAAARATSRHGAAAGSRQPALDPARRAPRTATQREEEFKEYLEEEVVAGMDRNIGTASTCEEISSQDVDHQTTQGNELPPTLNKRTKVFA